MADLKYFGTDGIRGTAGTDPMTAEFVFRLGIAAGEVLGRNKQAEKLFLIGRDTRVSGRMLQTALADGLIKTGFRVLDLGILPTPGIAFLTHKTGALAGAVISASHNPANENGIKFLTSDGSKLAENQEAEIEEIIAQLGNVYSGTQDEIHLEDGTYLYETYLEDLLNSQAGLDLSGLTIVMDCSNGAAYKAGPDLMRRLGANLVAVNTESDGVRINVNAGSEKVRSDPSVLAQIVKNNHADLGIAFDGDADRVILMDENGSLIDGDHMLAILADYLHAQGSLLGDALVTTIMANGALANFAEKQGFKLLETAVGDKYVTEELLKLKESNPLNDKFGVGGEQSGHIILLDEHHRTGDGLRTALFMLKVLKSQSEPSLASLSGKVQKFPQLVASCNVRIKTDLKSMPKLNEKLDKLKDSLPGLVRLNSRYSGTEPKYRLMLETDNRHSAEEVAREAWEICDLIQKETNTAPGAKIEVLNVSEGGLMSRPTA